MFNIQRFYPDIYVDKVTDITIDYLKENNIYGIILDVDNTLIDFNKNYVEGLEKWHKDITENGIKTIILSNTFNRSKIKKIADKLNIEYIYFANKPCRLGFYIAKKKLKLENINIAVIGDQIFTDILGANKVNMHSILVKPMIENNDYYVTRIKRPLEKKILKKYLEEIKNNKIEERND